MRGDERGAILIEFVGAYLIFFLLIFSVLALVNVISVMARVQNAAAQAANTLSMYSYVLRSSGLDERVAAYPATGIAKPVPDGAEAYVDKIREGLGALNGLSMSSSITSGSFHWEAVTVDFYTDGGDWGRPGAVFQMVADLGLGEMKNAGFYKLGTGAQRLLLHYLANGSATGEEYLDGFRVRIPEVRGFMSPFDNMLNASALIGLDGELRLTVSYDMDYTFFGLPLPIKRLDLFHTVMTEPWLGGSGEGYWEREGLR